MGKLWLKLWTETIHDRKLTRVSPVWRWAWIGLLALAAETDEDGKLELSPGVALTDDDIAAELSIALDDWQQAKRYFASLGMLACTGDMMIVTNYAKRQASSDPTAAKRQQDYRNRHSDSNALRNALRTPSQLRVEVEVEEEVDAEVEVEAEGEADAGTPAPPFESVSSGKRLSAKLNGLNGQVPEATRWPLVEKLLDLYGYRALVNTGDNSHLVAMHEQAVKLYQMGYHNADAIDALVKLWTETDWRGKKGDRPRNGQFIEFASQNVDKVKPTRKQPKKITITNPITGEKQEVTA